MSQNRNPPVHPGEVLQEEFFTPLEMSQYRLAKAIHVPPRRINEISHGKRGITADTALRLARFFGNSPEFWMRLQMDYDLTQTRDTVGAEIVQTIEPLPQPGGGGGHHSPLTRGVGAVEGARRETRRRGRGSARR
jgi:addiction module HigA family antidote